MLQGEQKLAWNMTGYAAYLDQKSQVPLLPTIYVMKRLSNLKP